MDRGVSHDSAVRKDAPMFEGLIKYFPDALFEVSRLSKIANDKHNPGEPLHWSKGKSSDHADCIIRHLTDIATELEWDEDNKCSPTVAIAWRALALLQIEIERSREVAVVDQVIEGMNRALPNAGDCSHLAVTEEEEVEWESRLREDAHRFIRANN